MPVGLLEAATYEVNTTQLRSGDKVIIYTDGLTDAASEEGVLFGTKRLLGVIGRLQNANCSDLHQGILEHLEDFTREAEQNDDVTLLVVEYLPE